MDRDIAEAWPYLHSSLSSLFGLLLLVPPLLFFAVVKTPEPVQRAVTYATALLALACLGIWVWRAFRYFVGTRLPELRSRRSGR